jgi:hypothetical protein
MRVFRSCWPDPEPARWWGARASSSPNFGTWKLAWPEALDRNSARWCSRHRQPAALAWRETFGLAPGPGPSAAPEASSWALLKGRRTSASSWSRLRQGLPLEQAGRDLAGLNAWKTFAYFFGAPAINADTRKEIRPLDDTSPELRAAARADRLWVAAFHIAAPLLALAAGGAAWPAAVPCCGCCRWSPCCSPSCGCGPEHGAVDDLGSPLAARTNRTWGRNRLAARLFPHHVNYHLEHHLYPAVPHYHLPRLHRLLQRWPMPKCATCRRRGRVFAARRSVPDNATHEVFNQPEPLADYDLFAGNAGLQTRCASTRRSWTPRRAGARRWQPRRCTRAWPTCTRRSCAPTTATAAASTRSSSTPATTR